MRQTRGRQRGITLVELLITIFITAIAFAALVPLFVQASKSSAGDKARVVALNIAQDRIEKVRRLSFASLTNENLNVDYASDPDSPFVTTQYAKTESGAKAFTVQCEVADLPVSETDTRVASRKIDVTVSWSAPSPGGSVATSTIVYRQYAGPQITDFRVSPVTNDFITSPDVTLTVTVDPSDVASMRPVTLESTVLTGYVVIRIAPIGGASVIPEIKLPFDPAHPTTFTASWSLPYGEGVGDGYYRFSAVAYTADASPGNTWKFSKHVETGDPGPVRELQGTAALGSASITWLPSLSADVDHYEVYRTGPDGIAVRIAGDPLTQPKWKETGLTDTGLTVHETYTYTVQAVDQANPVNRTSASLELYVKSASDIDAPLPATNLKGDPNANAASLVWEQSPSTFVLGYQVFANGDTTTPVATVSTPYVVVGQDWNTTASYQVKPYRDPLLLSDGWASVMSGYLVQYFDVTPWVQVTTQQQTWYRLTIVNDVSAPNKRADISLYYLGPTGTDAATLIGTKTRCRYGNTTDAVWSNLAYGTYRWSWTTTDNPTRVGEREDAFSVGPGGVVNVTRHCKAVP